MSGKIAGFFALVLTALLLAPSVAHLASLQTKIGMDQQQYFLAQQVYRGWALFGIVLFGALLANLWLAIVLRRERAPCLLGLLAGIFIAASLGVFFTWIYPANLATQYWTTAPLNWAALRRQWEFAHAFDAVLVFVAFCCTALAVLRARWHVS